MHVRACVCVRVRSSVRERVGSATQVYILCVRVYDACVLVRACVRVCDLPVIGLYINGLFKLITSFFLL